MNNIVKLSENIVRIIILVVGPLYYAPVLFWPAIHEIAIYRVGKELLFIISLLMWFFFYRKIPIFISSIILIWGCLELSHILLYGSTLLTVRIIIVLGAVFFGSVDLKAIDKQKRWLRSLVLIGVIVTFCAIIEVSMGLYSNQWAGGFEFIRARSTLYNPNTFGYFIAICLVSTVGLAIAQRKNLSYLLIIVLELFALVLSGSRSAIVGGICAIFYLFIISKPKKNKVRYWKNVIILSGLLVVAVGFVFYLAPDEVVNRWTEHKAYQISANARIEDISKALTISKQTLVGLFFGRKFTEIPFDNTHIFLLTSYGLFYFVLWFSLFILSTIQYAKNSFIESKIFSAILVSFFIALSVSNMLNTFPNNIIFGAILGGGLGHYRLVTYTAPRK